mmetsp:Transcript_4445/g.13138  ORF Transcript_4445/g.13138 Transcript_4445/m.13138 type:complete len:262 (-) Transcript_4445:6-791(-)
MSSCVTVLALGMPNDAPVARRSASTSSAAAAPTARMTCSTVSTGVGCGACLPACTARLKASRWMSKSAQISVSASTGRPSFSNTRARRRRTLACVGLAASTVAQSSSAASRSSHRSRHALRLLYSATRCERSDGCASASSMARENHVAASPYLGGDALKSSKAFCLAALNSPLTSSAASETSAAGAGAGAPSPSRSSSFLFLSAHHTSAPTPKAAPAARASALFPLNPMSPRARGLAGLKSLAPGPPGGPAAVASGRRPLL